MVWTVYSLQSTIPYALYVLYGEYVQCTVRSTQYGKNNNRWSTESIRKRFNFFQLSVQLSRHFYITSQSVTEIDHNIGILPLTLVTKYLVSPCHRQRLINTSRLRILALPSIRQTDRIVYDGIKTRASLLAPRNPPIRPIKETPRSYSIDRSV